MGCTKASTKKRLANLLSQDPKTNLESQKVTIEDVTGTVEDPDFQYLNLEESIGCLDKAGIMEDDPEDQGWLDNNADCEDDDFAKISNDAELKAFAVKLQKCHDLWVKEEKNKRAKRKGEYLSNSKRNVRRKLKQGRDINKKLGFPSVAEFFAKRSSVNKNADMPTEVS